ncbi:SIS domain-containing protein [Sneathiella glossodoripedis]|uniref:SIS domain-containing protein n=1 Tax=Sneathiella glossodoripedis TaxID=418853 RepID=UPI0004722B73|nr:SIS domain-containing protein [Sneathiella glossodoripedis]
MSDQSFAEYAQRLFETSTKTDLANIDRLYDRLLKVWRDGDQLFLCGNGGSAGNASHLANDFIYGIDRKTGKGLKAHALTGNVSIVTCLANDEGYDQIFAKQLGVYANPSDVLLVLSGSGNSPNVIKALEYANNIGMDSFAILGFGGGAALELAKHPIHFKVNDMQISEDLQLMVMHHIMQKLCHDTPSSKSKNKITQHGSA